MYPIGVRLRTSSQGDRKGLLLQRSVSGVIAGVFVGAILAIALRAISS